MKHEVTLDTTLDLSLALGMQGEFRVKHYPGYEQQTAAGLFAVW